MRIEDWVDCDAFAELEGVVVEIGAEVGEALTLGAGAVGAVEVERSVFGEGGDPA